MEQKRYQNGKIYKLVNNVDDEIYVGSTCQSLAKRLYWHKLSSVGVKSPIYLHINKVGVENIKIILVEEYSCDSKIQLLARERYWINKLEASLNRNKNPGLLLELGMVQYSRYSCRRWRTKNREYSLEMGRRWHAENKDRSYKTHRKWIIKNKDYSNKYARQYRLRNKERINRKTKCGCSGSYSTTNITNHLRTKKHQEWLKLQEAESDSDSSSEDDSD